MRFIPRNCIPPEAILAKPILGINGEVLLNEGVVMKPSYIKRLERLGIAGAYVYDPISEDLTFVTALSDELKSQAIKSISSTFSKALKGKQNMQATGALIMKTAEQIVDEILSHGDVMLNIFDMKAYDSYTYYHCVSVTVLSVVIGLGLNLERKRLVKLAYAALLHDIGKVTISPEIINKRGALTTEEYELVKGHARAGHEFIRERFSETIAFSSALGVLEHHERVDGTGYPDQKKGDRISQFGKIIAVADVYDALVSDRPYRKGVFPVEAMEYIQGGCDRMFEIDIVHAFTQKIALFPVGSCVLLSNGATGLVMENFEGLTQRPYLKVFMVDGHEIHPFFLNLSVEALDVTIVATAAL